MKSIRFLSLALLAALPSVAEDKTAKELSPAFTIPSPAIEPVPLLAPGTLDHKFQRYLSETYGPGRQISTLARSAFSQAIGGSADWGTGAGAYRNRISSQMANHAARNTIRFGFDAALGTDSRYRKSEFNGFASRLGHALLSSVTTNRDGGGRMIGIPQIAGAYGSAFASNLWYPNTRNSTGDALIRGTSALGFSAGKNVFREFWPDIKQLFRGR